MTPLIPNGIYKIRNDAFSNYVVDLIDGVPMSPICAYKDRRENINDKWRIRNHESGGNYISIECLSVRGTFADSYYFPGASLVGYKVRALWTVIKVGENKFRLQSPDGQFVWQLPNGAGFVNIVLVRHTVKTNTTWMFEKLYD